MLRADIHTRGTVSAPGFKGSSGRIQRGIGEDADPADAWSVIRGDEQAALSYPSKTREVCREFLGDYTADVFIVSSSGRRNREGTMTRSLEGSFAMRTPIWSSIRLTTS